MTVSLADVLQVHGYLHRYPVDVGADPLVAVLCDADIRADFAATGTTPYRHVLGMTLEACEGEARKADEALACVRAWGN